MPGEENSSSSALLLPLNSQLSQGKNRAGWGEVSNTETLAVFYPPVSEEQRQAQSVTVSKGATVELDCALKHKGFPEAEAAVWLKDGIRMKDQSGLRIRVENAGVASDRKFTCIPFNKVGDSQPSNGYQIGKSAL